MEMDRWSFIRAIQAINTFRSTDTGIPNLQKVYEPRVRHRKPPENNTNTVLPHNEKKFKTVVAIDPIPHAGQPTKHSSKPSAPPQALA